MWARMLLHSTLATVSVHTRALPLQKELEWLLDDAVEACCGPGTQRCRAWRDVKRCSAGRAEGCSISLRLQLQDLGELWRQRLQGRCAPRSALLPGKRCSARHQMHTLCFAGRRSSTCATWRTGGTPRLPWVRAC